jgi:hypothetical protein
MIILFGIRRRGTRLGSVFLLCPHCQAPAAQVISRVRKWCTVFFIPVIPLGTTYSTTCTMCGRSGPITAELADRYVAQEHQVAASGPPAPRPTEPDPN